MYEVSVTVTTTYLVEADNIPDAYEQYHNYDNFICVLHEEETTDEVKPSDGEYSGVLQPSHDEDNEIKNTGKKRNYSNHDWS